MKWTKQGLLFEPQRYALPNGCTDYAQSPQALVFDDFVRIYFSTRTRDGQLMIIDDFREVLFLFVFSCIYFVITIYCCIILRILFSSYI